jgi:protein Tob/BTG
MFTEINSASDFICRYLYKLEKDKIVIFKNQLIQLLSQKYNSHWDLSNPIKGGAFRSITIIDGRIDSIILAAAQKAGLDVSSCFTSDLIIWCDPYNVSYRVGGDYNRICSIYDENSTTPIKKYEIPKKSIIEIKPDLSSSKNKSQSKQIKNDAESNNGISKAILVN